MWFAVANDNFDTDPDHIVMALGIIAFITEAGWPRRDLTRIDLAKKASLPEAVVTMHDDGRQGRNALALPDVENLAKTSTVSSMSWRYPA